MSRLLQSSSMISAGIAQNPLRRILSSSRASSFASTLYNESNGRPKLYPSQPCYERLKLYSPLTKSFSSPVQCFHMSVILKSEESSKSAEQVNTQEQKRRSHGTEKETCESQWNDPTVVEKDREIKGETIVGRLRRLSETPAEYYELSPVAQQKIREMERKRTEVMEKGESWKWDQRNLLSGGPPTRVYTPKKERFHELDWNRDDENFSSREFGTMDDMGDRYNREGMRRPQKFRLNRHRSAYQHEEEEEEVEDEYEMEIQKLKDKVNSVKAKKVLAEGKTARLRMENEEYLTKSATDADIFKKSSELSNFSNPAVQENKHKDISMSQEAYTAHTSEAHTSDTDIDLSEAIQNPDNFGTLTVGPITVKDYVSQAIQRELKEEEQELSSEEGEDEDDTRFIPEYNERWNCRKLINKSRELLEEKKLQEAIDLFLGVLKQGGFKFDDIAIRHHFHVLINECAQVGYVDMAFRLFNLMKKRRYKESAKVVSSLLNACANSPWDKENNLDKIERLLLNLKERGRYMNLINYTALIKAYGRLGEIVLAFGVVDKMIEEGNIQPNDEIFNMLLHACITDTKSGFRHALVTLKKMQLMQIQPDIYTYNLLFRAVRDCGIEIELPKQRKGLEIEGNSETIHNDLHETALVAIPPIIEEEDSNRILNYLVMDNSVKEDSQISINNLGEPMTFNIKMLKKALQVPQNRLALLGGIRGVTSHMVRNKVGPNLKTLTALLDCARADEITDILQLFHAYKMKGDVMFYTKAIAHCYKCNRPMQAKEVIKMMNHDGITPNIATWGAISLGCATSNEARELIKQMDDLNVRVDIRLMGSLLAAAHKKYDPKYFLFVLEEIKRRDMPISEEILRMSESFRRDCQRGLVSMEMGKEIEIRALAEKISKNPYFGDQFAIFKMRYPVWLKSVDIEVQPDNPWEADWVYFKMHQRHKQEEEKNVLAIDLDLQNVKAKNR